jgi:tripartite-type tricarboxylate transporter receptor subunit TctC
MPQTRRANTAGARAAAVALLLCLAGFCTNTWTQAYPLKPIRLIVTFPPGASSDVVGRMLGQKLAEFIGTPVVPDNRAGAGGNVGLAMAAKTPPDGYTIVIATGSIAISPALYLNPGYDALKDLAPVARLTSMSLIMLVHPSVPVKTLRQFIDLARANPGKLNFGSGGAGTTNHLANELLKHLEKINIVHVPYKGVTQAMAAMMGGEVDQVVMPVTTAITQVRAGKVRALAVLADKRASTLPEVPTAKEAGLDGFAMPVWYGMFAPAGTPRDIVSRLSRELVKVLEAADIRERLAALDVEPWPGTQEQLGELLRAEIARNETIARSARLAKQ